ncbi:MAG: 23S rRNA (adenine(2503)-C(2))-methyltransferase RlmN [bacterium]|nr:23S rRNA (adenine(2503)-C(2))-methyltransferase RlmN [bacterium]
MDLGNLEKVLKEEPNFRLKQAKKAVFFDLIENWQEATVLPLALREKLSEVVPLKIEAETSVSNDEKTVKALLWLKDGLRVETVLMRYPSGRNTICVSSEVGCPLNCSFCATGKMGFKRNLESFEIIEQVLFFARYLKKLSERVTNIVFMGMGEPFLNYDKVMAAIRILNSKDGLNIGARHISISTVGVEGGINKLTKEPLQINLAISLHAPNDELRTRIVPANKAHSLKAFLDAVDNYLKETKRKVMFQYIMIKGVNDSPDLAGELINLLRRFKKSLFMVNLILYNPTGVFEPSEKEQIKKFRQVLEEQGIEVTERYRFGRGIKAACGQLASYD